MNDKEIAKAYSTALEIDGVSLNEIIEWADSKICAEDEPNINVIELSGCKKTSEATTFLNQITLGANDAIYCRILFSIFYNALKTERCSYSLIAEKLYFLAMENNEMEKFGELCSFWDALELAEQGHCGDPVVIRKEMLEFLAENKQSI